MPGIRVDTPIGDGWEYSFDNVTWQTSNIFRSWIAGQAFVEGTTYTVYCRNLVDNQKATNSILYKSPGNSTSARVGLDDVLNVDPHSDIVPHFEGGLNANLPPATIGAVLQRVVIDSAGNFYVQDSSALEELDTPEKKDAFLADLLASMSEATHALLCEKNATCPVAIPPVLDQFDFFEFVPNESGQLPPSTDQFDFFEFVPNDVATQPALDPQFMVRLDGNNCGVNGNYGVIDGWVADLNHPNDVQSVRIKRDGVFRADVVCTVDRPDVRDYLISQGLIPAGTTFARYGYSYAKLQGDSDGKAHEWRVYGGTSSTEAISDTGAQNTVTCGSSSPTITQQVIGGVISLYEGEDGTVFVTNNYSSGPSGPYIGQGEFSFEGSYPDGVTITMGANATAVIHVPADCVTEDVIRPLLFTFPGSPSRVIRQDFRFKNMSTADPNANPANRSEMIVSHGNDFSAALGSDPAQWTPGYTPIRGNWNWGNGTLCQTAGLGNTTPLLFKGDSSSSAYNRDITIAKVKMSALNSTQSWVGIGLRFEDTGYQGYSLFVDNANTIGLVHHGIGIGPTVAFKIELNTWYWQKMIYQETGNNTAKIFGKMWKAGEAEPADWTVVWADQPRENGYPALFGGTYEARACFDDWYDGNTGALSIDRMAIYYPYGWRNDPRPAFLSENLVLLVNVAGSSGANANVQAQYVQSRNDASFGLMQKIDYSKNDVPPNILPTGFTHFTRFNDETFSTALRTFRAKITTVTGSQVEAVYQAPVSSPDQTTAQIYPASN